MMDDRATSSLVSHVLTIGITAILIVGLLMSAGTLLQDQREHSARQQLGDVGGHMAKQFERVDRLNDDGRKKKVALNTSHPGTIAGESYSVHLETTGSVPRLVLRMPTLSLRQEFP
ncbi:hypothetical protein VB779_02745 [Haloarculaceae archaeon H-GB11]|nr:hypothetical protein [Haloarculaceae archaeon H-GB11]